VGVGLVSFGASLGVSFGFVTADLVRAIDSSCFISAEISKKMSCN